MPISPAGTTQQEKAGAMDAFLKNLLSLDATATAFGCGLNPALKAAIETDLRFLAKATVPNAQRLPDNLPENVVPLAHRVVAHRKSA